MEAFRSLDAHRKGFLLASVGVVLITTNYVSVKAALASLNAETFSFLWTFSAALYALLILVAAGGRQAASLPRQFVGPIVLVGTLNGAGSLLTWKGLSYLDPSLASFLWRFHPVLTLLLGVVFLGERFLAIELVPVGLMITGAFLTVAPRWETLSIGVLLTLLACLISSFQMFLVKVFLGSCPPERIVFYRNAIGSFWIGGWAILTRSFEIHASAQGVLWIPLVASLLGETISFSLLFKSFVFWGLSRTSLLRTAEPILVILWAYLLFHSLPGTRELIGGSLLLVGVILFSVIHYLRWRAPSRSLDPAESNHYLRKI